MSSDDREWQREPLEPERSDFTPRRLPDERDYEQIHAAIERIAALDPDASHSELQRFAGAAHGVAQIAVIMLADRLNLSVEAVLDKIEGGARNL